MHYITHTSYSSVFNTVLFITRTIIVNIIKVNTTYILPQHVGDVIYCYTDLAHLSAIPVTRKTTDVNRLHIKRRPDYDGVYTAINISYRMYAQSTRVSSAMPMVRLARLASG